MQRADQVREAERGAAETEPPTEAPARRAGLLGNLTTFDAFQVIPYRWYLSSSMIGTVGFQMQGVALGWLVYILTHSAVHLGLVTTM